MSTGEAASAVRPLAGNTIVEVNKIWDFVKRFPPHKHFASEKSPKGAIFFLANLTKIEYDYC